MYKILPYYGFGNNNRVEFKGRVVIDNDYESYRQKTGFINSLIGFWKRFSVRPACKIEVQISFENQTTTAVTNQYGIFSTTFDPHDLEDDKWLVAQARIHINTDKVIIANLTSINNVVGNEFGIISDIDDTILISQATKKLELIYLTVFKKPAERKAFAGTAEFYNHLVQGSNGESTNPIFYVSSSHWNLFDLLNDFMEINKFPRGPLLLKRVRGIWDMLKTVGNHSHKREKIVEVLETYPELKFVLVGDSGQQDAAIYATIARQYPDQIKAILIRDVTPFEDPIVAHSIQVTPDHIPFKIFTTNNEANAIARNLGLIS